MKREEGEDVGTSGSVNNCAMTLPTQTGLPLTNEALTLFSLITPIRALHI